MIEFRIRPQSPTLRCESRRPRREPGMLRWSLAAVIIAAAGLDAVWLVPARAPEPRSAVHYSEVAQQRHCRKLALERELQRVRAEVRAIELELETLKAVVPPAHRQAPEVRIIDVALVPAKR